MIARVRSLLAVSIALAAVPALAPLGCRNALGIQELGSDQLTCDAYCDAVQTACGSNLPQYESRTACLALCRTFPVGTVDDTSGNTLGCRLRVANLISSTGEGDCAAAGPGGAGQCGADCDSFCASAAIVCPTDFASEDDCKQQCQAIPSCGPYHVVANQTPDVYSVQCRLFHVTSAALDPTTHCPHVKGVDLCTTTSAMCPTDAGAGDAASE